MSYLQGTNHEQEIVLLCVLNLFAISVIACGNNEATATPITVPVTGSADPSPANTEAATEAQTDTAAVAKEATNTNSVYAIVDTGQGACYNSNGDKIDCPLQLRPPCTLR